MKIRHLVMLWMLVVASAPAVAQHAGCSDLPRFNEFDFWLGNWEVIDNRTGNRAGSNSISKTEAGCLIIEKWLSGNSGTGTSINYFNPVQNQWRQLWVSAGQYSIDIVGGLKAGSMVLEGDIYYFSGNSNKFRGTWTPNDDGSVRQFFEQFNEDTNSWDVWFDGRYVKQ